MFNPPALPRPAPEHGRHLRIRLARRRLAHPARVREARPAADGVRRRHGAASATPRSPRPSSNSATRSPATAGAGSTTRTSTRRPSASTCARACEVIERLTGERPLGWYTGRDSPNTRRLVADYGGFEYDSDYYGDDLPFWMQVRKTDGARGAAPGRALHAGLQRHALRAAAGLLPRRRLLQLPARQLRRALRRRRRGAEDDEHRHALPPARPARRASCALQRFLDHVERHDRVWVCRRIDIARHWKQAHPFDPHHAP